MVARLRYSAVLYAAILLYRFPPLPSMYFLSRASDSLAFLFSLLPYSLFAAFPSVVVSLHDL